MNAKNKIKDANANKEAEGAAPKEDSKVNNDQAILEGMADNSSAHAAGAAFGVPLNNPSQIQAANAQAQMMAAFNY